MHLAEALEDFFSLLPHTHCAAFWGRWIIVLLQIGSWQCHWWLSMTSPARQHFHKNVLVSLFKFFYCTSKCINRCRDVHANKRSLKSLFIARLALFADSSVFYVWSALRCRESIKPFIKQQKKLPLVTAAISFIFRQILRLYRGTESVFMVLNGIGKCHGKMRDFVRVFWFRSEWLLKFRLWYVENLGEN